MAIRMTGLNSGLDTDSIVSALMSAQSLKKTKVVQSKTKLEWTQTKWSDLNTKLTDLYNNYVTKMRLQSTYKSKKATMSDTSKATVTAASNAVDGNYTMEVKSIASTQYLTGAKINASSTSTKLTSLDPSLENKTIEYSANGTSGKLEITSSTTIADLTSALKSAGLNASYDTTQKRLFISSKTTGVENAFTITCSSVSEDEKNGAQAVKDAVGYSSMTTANKAIVDSALTTLQTSGTDSEDYTKALDSLAKASYETQTASINSAATKYVKATYYAEKYAENLTAAGNDADLKAEYFDTDGSLLEGKTQEDYDAAVAAKADADTVTYVNEKIATDEGTVAVGRAAFEGKTEDDINALDAVALGKYYSDGVSGFDKTEGLDQNSVKASIEAAVEAYASLTDRNNSENSALAALGLAAITLDDDGNVLVNGGANDSTNTSIPSGMALVAASDSKIVLNGAELTSSTSTVTVNGLTIALTGTTKAGETVGFSVANDVDGVYNQVKEFLKEYNSVMKEMYDLYNASSATGYEPLTDDEKDAMSDTEVETYENKIKDSLLRNDTTLSSIMQGMRNAMMSSVTIDGKKYALSSFGIMTSTDFTEGGQLHIYGDSDDSTYSSETDKLKAALTSNPDATTAALADIFENLRTKMSDLMKGSTYSSALTFYNDIKMKDQVSDYEDEIEDWEDKLADMEDRYYDKFSAMETALAKLQSQQSSLSSLFGS